MAESPFGLCVKAIDESVFNDDETTVMKLMYEWHSWDRHEHVCGCTPFTNWYPTDSPIVDLSWLALGFDLAKEDYVSAHLGHYTYYEPFTPVQCDIWHRNQNMPQHDQCYCKCTACSVTARADRILESMLEVDVPDVHATLFVVARRCLILLKEGLFPVAPMIAHRWIIGGTIISQAANTWSPAETDAVTYQRPGRDFMSGMELLIAALRVTSCPSDVYVDPPLIALPLPIHHLNLDVAIDAWPPIRTHTFPEGFLPFWESELMHSCYMYTATVSSFTGHEFVQNPDSDPWSEGCKSFYIDSKLKFVLAFVRGVNDKDSLPKVTVLKISIRLVEGQYQVFMTDRIGRNPPHPHRQEWRMLQFPGQKERSRMRSTMAPYFALGGRSVMCRPPGQKLRAPPFFPMLWSLIDHRDNQFSHLMIRLMSIPDFIDEAINVLIKNGFC